MDHCNQVLVGICEEKFTNFEWERFGLIVWGVTDDGSESHGSESPVVFRDHLVDHALEGCIHHGFFAIQEVLLDGSVQNILLDGSVQDISHN
jgi:hypothetical protein